MLGVLLESFRKIAIAAGSRPLLPDAMVSALPTDDVCSDLSTGKGKTGWRDRLAVLSRIVVAVAGSYAVASLATALAAVALPLPRAEAASAATMASFLVLTGTVISVFAAASLRRATLGIGGAAALLAAGLWLAGVFTPAMPA